MREIEFKIRFLSLSLNFVKFQIGIVMLFLLQVYLIYYLGCIIGEKSTQILLKYNKSSQFNFFLFFTTHIFLIILIFLFYYNSFYDVAFLMVIFCMSIMFGILSKLTKFHYLSISNIFHAIFKNSKSN